MPIRLGVAEPISIFCCFKFCQLPHVDTIATAHREKLAEVVFTWAALELDNQTPATTVAVAAFDAGDA